MLHHSDGDGGEDSIDLSSFFLPRGDATSSPLPFTLSEDIWDKFGFPKCVMTDQELFGVSDIVADEDRSMYSSTLSDLMLEDYSKLRQDCMWAGLCPSSCMNAAEEMEGSVNDEVVVADAANVMLPASHHGDPMSDCDDVIGKSVGSVGVSEGGAVMGESDTDKEPETPPAVTGDMMEPSAEDHSYWDHSYHAVKKEVTRDDLGLLTPSDSEEEEVDVCGDIGYTCMKDTLKPSNGTRRVRVRIVVRPTTTQKYSLSSSEGIIAAQPGVNAENRLYSDLRSCVCQLVGTDSAAASHSPLRRSLRKRAHSPEVDLSVKRQMTVRRKLKSVTGGESSGDNEWTEKITEEDEEEEVGGHVEKRTVHNSQERQRRIYLRKAFDTLRSLVPETSLSERAAKIVILQKAASFCRQLTEKEERLTEEKDRLKRERSVLQRRFSALTRNCSQSCLRQLHQSWYT